MREHHRLELSGAESRTAPQGRERGWGVAAGALASPFLAQHQLGGVQGHFGFMVPPHQATLWGVMQGGHLATLGLSLPVSQSDRCVVPVLSPSQS